ncbi:MAG: phosphatidate cytidylyltransferase [Planctomycetota bacterium]
MLRERLRTSAVLIGISVTLVLLDWGAHIPGLEGIWLYPLLLFFSIGTAWEIASILLAAGHVIRRSVAVVGAALVSMAGTIPSAWAFTESGYPPDCPVGRLGWIPLVAVLTIFGILVSEMRYFDRTMLTMDGDSTERGQGKTAAGETIQRTCAAVFVSMYVGLPMSMLVATRMMHADATQGRFGLAAIITLLAVTKVTDAGAFFAGRAFGRRKLIPSLSPAKTVEGAAGGVLAATVVAYLCLQFLFGWFVGDATVDKTVLSETAVKSGLSSVLSSPVWGACLLGPAVAITAMLGDLAESLFKRDAGVKDSGTLLPGLGGVWDVTDSLLAASVPAFFCFAAGVGGQ